MIKAVIYTNVIVSASYYYLHEWIFLHTFAKDDKEDSDNSRIRCRGFVGCIVNDKA